VLKQRMITAFFLLLFILGSLFYLSVTAFSWLMFFVSALIAWEWGGLLSNPSPVKSVVLVALSAALCLILMYVTSVVVMFCATAAVALLCVEVVYFQRGGQSFFLKNEYISAVFCLVLIAGFFTGTIYLQHYSAMRPMVLLYVFILTWSADSAAYFVGRKWGRVKLCNRVSPKKTDAGFYGGLIADCIVALFFCWYFALNFKCSLLLIVLSVVVSIVSVFGDLSISVLKRLAGKKDTGKLLPGHGGVLDRVDSLIFTVTIAALFIRLFGL
jgi:phosphatidate cytidylyltransferase